MSHVRCRIKLGIAENTVGDEIARKTKISLISQKGKCS